MEGEREKRKKRRGKKEEKRGKREEKENMGSMNGRIIG